MTHDELVMWIYNNARTVVGALDVPGLSRLPGRSWEITGRYWEVPVVEKFGRNHKKDIGFIDMVIHVDVIYEATVMEYNLGGVWHRNDHGFVDPYAKETREVVEKRATGVSVIIEAKPRIDDLGALIRQLRTYRTDRSIDVKCVVSPDDRHATILREQGFMFYRAPRDLNNLELGL